METNQEINEGAYGAKRISWRHENPREALRRIVESAESDEDRLTQFIEWAKGEPGRLAVLCEYYYANTIRSLDRPTSGQRRKRNAEAPSLDYVKEIKARAKSMVLLDFVLPSGRMLKEATGAECTLAGGWLSIVGAKVGAERIVGDVMSEADLQDAFAR